MRAFLAFSEDTLNDQVLSVLTEAKNLFVSDYHIDFNPDLTGVGSKSTVFALGNDYLPQKDERVVYAPSPAQIMSKPDILTRLGNAFKLLVDPPKFRPMVHKVVRGLHDLPNWTNKDVVLDIETSGDVDKDLPEYERVISIAIYDGGSMVYVIPEHIVPRGEIRQYVNNLILMNRIITVNGKFDLKYFDEEALDHFDVQLASYSLFPAAGEHGLKPLAKNIFGADDWDVPGKKYTTKKKYKEAGTGEDGSWWDAREYSGGSGYERIPRKMLYEYNGYDVYWTWHLKEWAEELLAENPNSTRVFNFLMRLSAMFLRAEKRGLTYDIDHLAELETILQFEYEDEKKKLYEIAGRVLNPNSPKQVKDWFVEQGKALPMRRGKKKMPNGSTRTVMNPSSNEDALTEVIESEGTYSDGQKAFAEQLITVRYYNKVLGTYVTGYLNQCHGNRGFPTLKLFASITGRLGGGGPSPLTLPREKRLKQMVVASGPGRMIATADLSQAELRVMALESGDPWLIAAFQPDAGDFFDILLAQAYPDKDWDQLHFHPKDKEEAEWYNNMRAAMKGVVYGASFARGVPAIAKSLKISIVEAQKLYDGFIRPGSVFDMWRKEIERKAISGEPITTIYGRHFQSELITDKNKDTVTRSALSFTSQSTANDLCLDAALAIEPQLAKYDAWLLTTLHDAIYVDAPEEHAETVARLIAHEMQQAGIRAYGTEVLFKSDGGVGKDMANIYDLAA